ncbi:WXG100 family type VII secretion target, partial [Micromonospora lupini]|uniref:WXG100 family type VII secretion target n=1 Tax=Micromonospora lupini TaxID=285679 RepID=UPI0033EAA12C
SYTSGGGSTWSFDDGSKVSYDGSGDVTSQVSVDGAVFSAFTGDGPTHVVLPDGGAASISYGAKGSSVWSFDDGSKVSYDGASHVTSQVSPDGTVFSRFDTEDRPAHATVPGSGEVTISYTSGGGSTWSYVDGTHVERNAAGAITRETTSDGTVFDRFDADGRAVHGRVPGADGQPPQTVSIAYKPNGDSTWTYHDAGGATTMTLSRGASGKPLTMVQDGWTFRNFDGEGRPTAGHGPDGDVTISYGAHGVSTWTFTDEHNARTVIDRDGSGHPTRMISDGWTYTKFDDSGRPLVGHKPGENGGAGETVTIAYGHGDSSVWKYGDGTVITRTGDGRVTSLVVDGWTYTKFDDQGRPTYGTKDGKHISISYQGDWTVTRYPDGTKIGTDSHGHPIYQINPDGSRFEYRVEIPKLLQAKTVVAAQASLLDGHLTNLKTQTEAIFEVWQSPAGRQYEAVVGRITAISNNVQSVLHDSVVALGRAYDQYVAAEGGNLKNLTPVNFNSDGSVTPR